MYSFSNSVFSSRSWYRTWNSAAYHHWDPRQTVSYEVFFSFLFFFGGSDISVVNRVVEEAKPLEDCGLHAAEIIWACVNSLRQLDLHLTLYFAKHHLQKKKNTHADTQKADMINSDGKGEKSGSMLLRNFSFLLLLTCQNPQTSLNCEGFRLRFPRLGWALVHKHFLPIKPDLNQQSGLCSQVVVVFCFVFFVIFAFRARWTFSLGPSVCVPPFLHAVPWCCHYYISLCSYSD